MSSVTQRIKEIKQPRGGYIKPSSMNVIDLNDRKVLSENENVHSSIIGMSVDYLTRFMMGNDIMEAFKISIVGAKYAEKLTKKKTVKEIAKYISGIKGLDDNSIINACKAVTFDVWFRNPLNAIMAKSAKETNPNKDTINNIRILVQRSISFWEKFGPIEVDGFTFEPNGYTKTVDSGDGDFLTSDTLWDFKVSKNGPKSSHTLQLLMYYIMGQHSGKPEFKSIKRIGIFNPKLNKVYQYDISDIPDEVIKIIEDEVICY
ncbi:MAG TPA: hypothetical protein DCR23_00510 [Ruminococcaceae bacterium]|nr:hypothetical protein [Oscillospiraceae bacterium]